MVFLQAVERCRRVFRERHAGVCQHEIEVGPTAPLVRGRGNHLRAIERQARQRIGGRQLLRRNGHAVPVQRLGNAGPVRPDEDTTGVEKDCFDRRGAISYFNRHCSSKKPDSVTPPVAVSTA